MRRHSYLNKSIGVGRVGIKKKIANFELGIRIDNHRPIINRSIQ